MLTKVLAQIHDTKTGAAKFTSRFNGNTKDTIRFIMAIRRFDLVSKFLDPDSLFIAVYNNVSDTIKSRFSADKVQVITRQKAALNNNPTDIERENAAIYSVTSMQKFFMKHFRPSITRGNIFRQLLDIRMRYNENPREVLDRTVTAIARAKQTIALYNDAGIGIALDKIRATDINHILTTIFCTKNNSTDEKNDGGINALVQKQVRNQELQYVTATKYNPWYTAIDAICAKVGGPLYAGDTRFKMVYHEPQILDLWESPNRSKPKPTPKRHIPPKRRNPYPYHPSAPKPKFQRTNNNPHHRQPSRNRHPNNPRPNTPRPNVPRPNRSTPTCFRCGKYGHLAIDCRSRADINGQTLRGYDRRQLNQMPFRGDYNAPKSPPVRQPNAPQPRTPYRPPPKNPNNFRPRNGRGNPPPQRQRNQWSRYPSNPSPHNNPNNATPQRPNSNPNQPQIHALMAQIQSAAAQDSHINQDLLTNIQSLASMIHPDNVASGYDPQ